MFGDSRFDVRGWRAVTDAALAPRRRPEAVPDAAGGPARRAPEHQAGATVTEAPAEPPARRVPGACPAQDGKQEPRVSGSVCAFPA